MRISEAFEDSKPLDVHYPTGAVLHIYYRPAMYSVEEMERIQTAERNPRRVLAAIRRVVMSWDLTDADGATIPIEEPYHNGMPLSEFVEALVRNGSALPDDLPSDPLAKIPTNIFTQIIRAVNEDQSPGEARKA